MLRVPIGPSLTLTIPLRTLLETDTKAPGAGVDDHRTPKLLAETFPLSNLENETGFPFTDLVRLGCGVRERIEAYRDLERVGRFGYYRLWG